MNQCQHLEKIYDRYKTVCGTCGLVLEENQIVSELNYGENAGGAFVHGQFVDISKDNINGHSSSRTITIQKFDRHFKYVAERLQLPDSIIDKARAHYVRALSLQLTQARRSDYVAAVLLAITTRQENLPYLLIDFANVFKINISELSSTFLDLTEELSISLPVQKPEIFVNRFCGQVAEDIRQGLFDIDDEHLVNKPSSDFGDEKKELFVRYTRRLVDLLQRMNLHVQKKPQLIVGAAMFLILNYMDIKCCHQQICDYIFMSKEILEKLVNQIVNEKLFLQNTIEQLLQSEEILDKVEKCGWQIKVNQEKRDRKYHTAPSNESSNRSFIYFENQHIYQMGSQKDDEASDQIKIYMSNENQVKDRERLFDQLYKDNMEYYIERRKMRRQAIGRKQRRQFGDTRESLQSVQELPKENRDMLLSLLAADLEQPEPDVQQESEHSAQRSQYELESESERVVNIF